MTTDHIRILIKIIMSNLINKRAVRAFALKVANSKYPAPELPDRYVDSTGREWDYTGAKKHGKKRRYTQVSGDFMQHIESLLRANIQAHIEKMDPKGSTIK